MTTPIRQRLLIAIGRRGRVDSIRDVTREVDSDEHNLIHVLWSLQRSGHVTFRQNKTGTVQKPTSIKLTRAGQNTYKELST